MDKPQELQQLTGRAEGLLSKVADDSSAQVQNLRNTVSETVNSTKNAISTANSAALGALKNAASSADDYVRENPWIAVGVIAGVAASVGFLAGYMAAPRKSLMGMLRR